MYHYRPNILFIVRNDLTDDIKKHLFADADVVVLGRTIKGSFDLIVIACELWHAKDWEWFHVEITPRLARGGETIFLT